jgi:PAS domain S-box-containing protein
MKGREKYLILLFLAIVIAGISVYTNPHWQQQIFVIAIVILISIFVLIDLFSKEANKTKTKQAENTQPNPPMSESEEKYRYLASIANNIQDPIISSDINYRVTEWNPAAERLFGWKSEEAIGRMAPELLKIKFLFGGREEALVAFKKESYWKGEVIYYTKDNIPINVLVTASEIRNDNGELMGNLVLVKDISSLKKAEIELQELNASLERLVEERTNELNKTNKDLNIY